MIHALIKSIFCLLLIANAASTAEFPDLLVDTQKSIEQAQNFYGGQETANLIKNLSEEDNKSCNYNVGFCCGRLTCFFTTDMGENHDSCSVGSFWSVTRGSGGAGAGMFAIFGALCNFSLLPFWGIGEATYACAQCSKDAAFKKGYERGTRCYPGDLFSLAHLGCRYNPHLSDEELEHEWKIQKEKESLEQKLREEERKLERARQQYDNATSESKKINDYKKEQEDATTKIARIQKQIEDLK